jgi:hypothetical protein
MRRRRGVASSLRHRPLYALGLVLTAWSAAQFWLCRYALQGFEDSAKAAAARFELAHPGTLVLVAPTPAGLWVRAGLECIAAVLLPTMLAICLVAGARKWLAASIAGYPLANALGGFRDGTPLGLGWFQPMWNRAWFTYGVFVDTAVLLAVVALLVSAMPDQPARPPIRWGFARVVPVAVLLAGWWVMRHPSPTAHDWVWLGDALTFVLVAAALADSVLPVAARLAAIGLLLPLSTGAVLTDVIVPHVMGFPATYFLHHTLIALATAAYVAGVPACVSHFREAASAAVAA